MTRFLPAVAAALVAVSLIAPLPVRAQELTLDQTRMLGAELLAAGDMVGAGTVAEALLARDGEDAGALILAARVAVAEDRFIEAADLAARAFGASESSDARFVAARLAARAHFEAGRYTRSQIWLRRARQIAPDAAEREAIAEDYVTVRQLNPLSLDLRFGVRPSSNINNGSQSETTPLLGTPFDLVLSRDAQALSGLAFDLGGSARYDIAEDTTYLTTVDVSLDGTTYALSSDARDNLSAAAAEEEADDDLKEAARLRDISGSDYAFVQLSFGLTHQHILREGAAPTRFAARLGQSWYGGSPYTQFLDASLGQSVQVGDRALLRLYAGAQKTFGEEDFDDSESLRFGGTLARVLERGDVLSLSLSHRISRSDNPEREYDSTLAAVDYALDQPVYGLGLSFGASIERRDFDFSSLANGPRRDETLSLTAEAEIGQVEYYGFRPVAQLELSRTRSDLALFDRQFVSLGFDLRSAF